MTERPKGRSRVERARRWPSSLITPPRRGCLARVGLAYLPEGLARPFLARRRLNRVLKDWCLRYSGDDLYDPSRRQPSAAFTSFVDVGSAKFRLYKQAAPGCCALYRPLISRAAAMAAEQTAASMLAPKPLPDQHSRQRIRGPAYRSRKRYPSSTKPQ